MPPATRREPCGVPDPPPARADPLGYRHGLPGVLGPRLAGAVLGERPCGRRAEDRSGPPPRARDGARAEDHFEPAIKKTSRQWCHPRRHPPPPLVASPPRGTVRATLTTRCCAVLASSTKVDRHGSTRAAQTVEPRDASYILACPIRRRTHDAETSTLWRGAPPKAIGGGRLTLREHKSHTTRRLPLCPFFVSLFPPSPGGALPVRPLPAGSPMKHVVSAPHLSVSLLVVAGSLDGAGSEAI